MSDQPLPPIGTIIEHLYEPAYLRKGSMSLTTAWEDGFWHLWRYRVVEHVKVMRFPGDTSDKLYPRLEPIECFYYDDDPRQGGKQVDPDEVHTMVIRL